jgi:5'-nucleotidase
VEVQILAINDFHGNLEPPKLSVGATTADGRPVRVPAGGAAYLVTAMKTLRQGHPHSLTVSAGDVISASPLVSSLFLDEPTIAAMELAGLDYNAVGNHEFDRGRDELLRIQRGGCRKFTNREPCALERYDGARFPFLSANVLKTDGSPLFKGIAIKQLGPVRIGIIGMTLKETATLVGPAGVAGLTFADEATSANALVPELRRAGANAIVLLIHQGGYTSGSDNDKNCPNLSGDILPIIAKLDPAIDVIVSGHTHTAYVCEVPRTGAVPLLLTSAGRFGTLVTDIRLSFDGAGKLVGHGADNRIVQSESYGVGASVVALAPSVPRYSPDPSTQALVDRYASAARPIASRVVGRLAGPVTTIENENGEQTAGFMVADAALAAGRDLGAQIAFTNSGGVRADLVPAADGTVTFGQIFTVQPFANTLVVMTLTGSQLKQALEQQFPTGPNDRAKWLLPSAGFMFEYDRLRPPGDRIVRIMLDGRPIEPNGNYRVAVNNFLASGGDNFSVFKEGANAADAGLDVDILSAWLREDRPVPLLGRMKSLPGIEPKP